VQAVPLAIQGHELLFHLVQQLQRREIAGDLAEVNESLIQVFDELEIVLDRHVELLDHLKNNSRVVVVSNIDDTAIERVRFLQHQEEVLHLIIQIT